MDLAQNGCLETVLRGQRRAFEESNVSPEAGLKARDLVVFCIHVASAMEYIAAKQVRREYCDSVSESAEPPVSGEVSLQNHRYQEKGQGF